MMLNRTHLRLSHEARLLAFMGNPESQDSSYAALRKHETQNTAEEQKKSKEASNKLALSPESVDKSIEARIKHMDEEQDKRKKSVEATDKQTKVLEAQAKKGQDQQHADATKARVDQREEAAKRKNKIDEQAKLKTQDYSVNAAVPVSFFTEQTGDNTQVSDEPEQKQKTAKVESSAAPQAIAKAQPEKKQAEANAKPKAEALAKDAKAAGEQRQEVAKATGVTEQQRAKSA
jgi:hypothetical protein